MAGICGWFAPHRRTQIGRPLDPSGASRRRLARLLTLSALAITVLIPAAASSVTEAGLPPFVELTRINAALKAWLEAVEGDELHLVFDPQKAVLRFQHGRNLLRVCPLRASSIGGGGGDQPIRQTLSSHLRAYRRHHPYAKPEPGPFDWEYYLVADATEECALSFSGGLVLFASDTWKNSGTPSLQLEVPDIRALYNSLEPGVPLIILPPGWNRSEAIGESAD